MCLVFYISYSHIALFIVIWGFLYFKILIKLTQPSLLFPNTSIYYNNQHLQLHSEQKHIKYFRSTEHSWSSTWNIIHSIILFNYLVFLMIFKFPFIPLNQMKRCSQQIRLSKLSYFWAPESIDVCHSQSMYMPQNSNTSTAKYLESQASTDGKEMSQPCHHLSGDIFIYVQLPMQQQGELQRKKQAIFEKPLWICFLYKTWEAIFSPYLNKMNMTI